MAFALSQDTLVESVLGPLDTELFSIFDLIEIEQLRDHNVLICLLLFIQVALADLKLPGNGLR